MIPLGRLFDSFLFAPLMFAVVPSAPNSVLSAFIFSKPPVGRAGDDALHRRVRQRDSPGVGSHKHRNVDVGHMIQYSADIDF
jgi:hypothetical protein